MKPVIGEKGFTLTEMLIAVALLMVMAIGATSALNRYMKQADRITKFGAQDSAFRSFAHEFNSLLKNSNVALFFQRLPIPTTGCGLSGPCVMKLHVDQQKFEAVNSTDFNGADAIEFFSDYEAKLYEQKMIAGDADTKIKFRKRLDLRRIKNNKEYDYYTTWTLIDRSSKPFVVLSKSKAEGYLTFQDAYGTANPPSTTGRWAIMKGFGDINVADFKKSLLAFYNGYNARQFWIQKVENMVSCSSNPTFCAQISTALNPSMPTSILASSYYAVNTAPVTSSDMGASFLPSITAFGTWWTQPSGLYTFPTSVASMYHPQNSDLASPLDVRKVSHFYHGKGLKSQIMAIPVNLVSYALEKQNNRFQLKMKTLPQYTGKPEITVMNDIPPTNKVIFARKIGTNQVSVLLYKN